MTDCMACAITKGKVKSIYEDDLCVVVLDTKATNIGQCLVVPRRHVPIIEQLNEQEIKRIFIIANVVSAALFEVTAAQGSNIFIANGVAAGQSIAHALLMVLPRHEKDDITLTWEGKSISEEQMNSVETSIKNALDGNTSEPQRMEQPTPPQNTDFLKRHIRQLP